MIRRPPDVAIQAAWVVSVVSLLLGAASCATHPPDDTPDDAPAPATRRAAQATDMRRVMQLSFGGQAAFGVCIEPACPAVTPKTLPVGDAAPMQAVVDRADSEVLALPTPVSGGQPAPAPQMRTPAGEPTPPLTVDTAIHRIVVVFPYASARLTVPARGALSASIARAHSEVRQAERIVITGRTDAVGDAKRNASLAVARARSVHRYLLDQVPDLAAVISIDARGGCCFAASNDTEAGRSKNRRAEIAFFSRGGA